MEESFDEVVRDLYHLLTKLSACMQLVNETVNADISGPHVHLVRRHAAC